MQFPSVLSLNDLSNETRRTAKNTFRHYHKSWGIKLFWVQKECRKVFPKSHTTKYGSQREWLKAQKAIVIPQNMDLYDEMDWGTKLIFSLRNNQKRMEFLDQVFIIGRFTRPTLVNLRTPSYVWLQTPACINCAEIVCVI